MELEDISSLLEVDFYQLNWSIVWWHILSFYWLIFALYVINANKKRQVFVLLLFASMTGTVSLLSTRLKGSPPPFYHITLLGFSLTLFGLIHLHQISKKRFGPYLFRFLLLLQLAAVAEDYCKFKDYPLTAEPFEGEILNVHVQYHQQDWYNAAHNGNYKMHITCFGNGKHLVLLEPGLPFSSLSMSGVAQQISDKYSNTTVCTYDRLGYGWSQRTKNDRTTINIINELRSLLVVAKLNHKHVIFIGWSYGGLIAQLYARLYGREMLGMVLVDSMSPFALKDDPDLALSINEGKEKFTIAKILTPLGVMRLLGFFGQLPPECGYPPFESFLPRENAEAMRALFFSQSQFLDTAYDELDDLVYSLNQSHMLLGEKEKFPENVPTVILQSNRDVSPLAHITHKRHLRISERKFEMTTKNSDHYIPLSEPDSIVEALQQLFILRKQNDIKQ